MKTINFANLSTDTFDLLIFVEGRVDEKIVTAILIAANLNDARIIFATGYGKKAVKKSAHTLPAHLYQKTIALVDADKENIPDSKLYAKMLFNNPPFPVFCAVPEIEAWLFADDELALKLAINDDGRDKIRRLPIPEKISYPKKVAKDVFGQLDRISRKIENMNIERAIARSASLRDFLCGIADILHRPFVKIESAATNTLSRDIFASLIRELIPSDTIIWRTSDGDEFTSQQLLKEIEEGSNMGKQYISDILRIARDMLARKARRRAL